MSDFLDGKLDNSEINQKFLELWPTQKTEKPFSWFTSVKNIIENDYILSANTYNTYSGEEEANHREPKEILEEIKDKEIVIQNLLAEIGKII